MYHLVDNFQTKTGDALVGYYVKLKDADGNYAALFSDANSTPIISVSGIADTAITDDNGQFDLFVVDGDYDIEFFDKSDIAQLVKRIPSVPMYGNTSAGAVLGLLGSTEAGEGASLVTMTDGTDLEVAVAARAKTADLADTTGASQIGVPGGGDMSDIVSGTINARAYGAVGDGATNDTDAIDAASALARSGGAVLYFPAGTYVYSGTGLYGHAIRGAGQYATTINLAAGVSLVVSPPGPAVTPNLAVSDLSVSGGFGLVRLTYTGVNSSAAHHRVENFRTYGCSGPAISSLASDHPWWKIKGLVHYLGGGPAGSMGVALAGKTDACEIDVDVVGASIGVKLGVSGPNARVRGSFVRGAAYTSFPRVAVWLVPDPSTANGHGGDIQFRFGNENKSAANDYHILVADQDTGAGSTFADYLPKLSADSTGYSVGWSVSNSMFADNGTSPAGPLIYTTTPKLYGVRVGPIVLAPARPSYIIQYRTVPGPDEQGTANLIGPILSGDRDAPATSVIPSNAPGTYVLIDHDAQFSRFDGHPMAYGGGNGPGDFTHHLGTADFVIAGTTTSVAATDSLGGDDAVELTFDGATTGKAFNAAITAANIKIGKPVWVEFELAPGSSSSLTDIEVAARYGSGTLALFWRAYIPITSASLPHRFTFTPMVMANNLQFLIYPHSDTSGGKVQIGRIRIYQAREPRNSGYVQIGQANAVASAVTKATANTTAVGNVGGGEDTLITYNLPAKAMRSTNKGVRITAWGTAANNANVKTLKAYFGTVAMLTATLAVSVAGKWYITAVVLRTAASAQDYFAKCDDSGATTPTLANGALTQAETSAITIKCTGTGTADNDIVQEGLVVEML